MQNQSLEYIVKTYFPLIEDKFNFRLGRPKGISFTLLKSSQGPIESCGLRVNTNKPNEKFCRFETLDEYRTVLRQYMVSKLGMYSITNNFEKLVDVVYQNTYLLAQDNINKRKDKLELLLAFEYAAVRNVNTLEWNTKTYIKLFKDKKMFGVTTVGERGTTVIQFNNDKDRYSEKLGKKSTINYKNIARIMTMYEEKLVLNNLQRSAILNTLLSYCK